jgi:hypothetical protein
MEGIIIGIIKNNWSHLSLLGNFINKLPIIIPNMISRETEINENSIVLNIERNSFPDSRRRE